VVMLGRMLAGGYLAREVVAGRGGERLGGPAPPIPALDD
jgi:hypothetical protein